MDKIAFIIGETFLYWSSIILTFAAATAVCMFLFLYLREENHGASAAVLVPLCIGASVIFARAVHWYCCANAYESFAAAMTTFTGGGYALMGVFAGCALTAALLRLVKIVPNLPMTYDCMALAGGAGIAVGRLACLFTAADRGPLVETIRALPIVYPVTNAVTGVVEWRFATFLIQSIATGAIVAGLMIFYLIGQSRRYRTLRDGDTACLFLSFYGASQIVLDSTRYDSLFMRSNGFISIVQILGAAAVILPMVYFSVRLVKARGFQWWYIPLWLAYAGLAGGAGYMEYWVQRHGDQAVFSYSVMSACLAAMLVMACVVRAGAVAREKKLAAAGQS